MVRHAMVGGFVFAVLAAAGCNATPAEDLGSDEAAAIPTDPANLFEQADTCARLFKRHAAVRDVDLDEGVIRWACADVPGVTDPNFGQEYCEYHAVQAGKLITRASQIAPEGGKVSCVFTSVFTGAGQAPQLKAAMADPANLGAAATSDALVQMQVGFNSRNAATQLFTDCTSASATDATKKARVTACYQAFTKGGPNAARLRQLCSVDDDTQLSAAAWSEAQSLGAKVATPTDADYDIQRDIASCMNVRQAGAPWRNSDPMICARVGRTASDCSCRFNSVPSGLMGVPFTGWTNDQIPASCRLAKVAGADYPYVAICDLSEKEVSDLPLSAVYSRSLTTYCHDKYSMDLVMKLPIRALQKPGTCRPSTEFCAEYMTGTAGEPAPSEPTPAEPVGETRKPAPDFPRP